jgi:hypothetical protein
MEKDTCISIQHVLPSKQTLSKISKNWEYFLPSVPSVKLCHKIWQMAKANRGQLEGLPCKFYLQNIK